MRILLLTGVQPKSETEMKSFTRNDRLQIVPAEDKTGLPLYDVICGDEKIRRNVTSEEVMRDFKLVPPPPVPKAPEIGDPWTYVVHTDRHACYLEEISRNGTQLTLREAKATLLNGANSGHPQALDFSPGGFCGHTSGEQIWKIEKNPDGVGAIHKVSLRFVNGHPIWKLVGDSAKSPGCKAFPGHTHYYDFNF